MRVRPSWSPITSRRGVLLTGALLACLAANAGCQTIGTLIVSRAMFQRSPLQIALVTDDVPAAAIAPLNPFPLYLSLQAAMSREIDRPIIVEPCFPFQAAQGLANGWYEIAILTPAQIARLGASTPAPFAVSVDAAGAVLRPALLVAAADGPIQSIGDLRGRRVAFGPLGDSRTHYAALQLLRDNGLTPADLAPVGLTPAGGPHHMADGASIARAVSNGEVDAGFIDKAAWAALGASADVVVGARAADLRVIGVTLALPDTLLVASEKLDSLDLARVRRFFLNVGQRDPEALKPLGVSGYIAIADDHVAACRALRVE